MSERKTDMNWTNMLKIYIEERYILGVDGNSFSLQIRKIFTYLKIHYLVFPVVNSQMRILRV